MQLRPYQTTVVEKLYKSHEVYDRVLLTLPTGSGKSVIAANITHNYPGYICVIAHRREIVDQLADALDTPHQILAPGHDWNAPRVTVASVDTLLARRGRLGVWPDMVGLWLIDEAHHMQPGNCWGKAADMFRFARGVGLTATPRRLDGRALPFGELITGASTAELMSAGWLCGYRAFAPATVAGVESLPVGSSGEYQQDPMRRVLAALDDRRRCGGRVSQNRAGVSGFDVRSRYGGGRGYRRRVSGRRCPGGGCHGGDSLIRSTTCSRTVPSPGTLTAGQCRSIRRGCRRSGAGRRQHGAPDDVARLVSPAVRPGVTTYAGQGTRDRH